MIGRIKVTMVYLLGMASMAMNTQVACAAQDGAVGRPTEAIGSVGKLPPTADGWLITPDEAREYRGEQGFNELPALRPRAMLPLIEIIKPEPAPDLKVKAPFAITVQFRGQAGTPIDPDSFRVLYGGFKIDITDRITKFVKVTPDGFSLENAKIPPGKHRLTLQVRDEKQQTGERELRFEVE